MSRPPQPGGTEIFIVDTSAIIDYWHHVYPTKQFPTFWDRFRDGVDAGRLIICSHVMGELAPSKEVHRWLNTAPSQKPKKPSAAELVRLAAVTNAHYAAYIAKVTTSYADPMLVAYAIENDWGLITSEVRAGGPTKSGNEPKLPDVCDKTDVRCHRYTKIAELMGWKF